MENTGKSKRWPVALRGIAAAVVVSLSIVGGCRLDPGNTPVTAVGSDSGDTIIAWQDSNFIYARRLNSSGQSVWGESGMVIAEFPPEKRYTWIPDGTGGAIFTWYEKTDVDHDDAEYFAPVSFYTQRIGAAGGIMWGNGGFIGLSSSHGVDFPVVVPDGTGGAVFVWNDYKPFSRSLHQDILCLKRLDAGGRSVWQNDTVTVAASTSYHELTEEEIAAGIKGTYARSWPTYSGRFAAVDDEADGLIVIWEEEISSRSERVYAQRFDGRGDAVWPERITVADEGLLSAETDGAGGAFVWTPEGTVYSGIGRVGTPLVVHLDSGGAIVSTLEYAPGDTVISDGLGGYICLRIEEDPPSGPPWDRRTSLYVQRRDAAGRALWPEVQIIDPGEKEQFADLEYITDGAGGVIIVWQVQKDSKPVGGIMAQRVDADGRLRFGEQGTPVFGSYRLDIREIADVTGDGSGGVIVVGTVDGGILRDDTVYAQKLDANGNGLWGDGVQVNR